MDKITFCIPSKSNLQYLKKCIPSIRENSYRKDHEIIVFVDSDEDGTIGWLEKEKDKYGITYYVNPELNKELYGIGRAYDYCVEKSATEVFMVFHADMILGKNADLNAWKHLKDKSVVCSTRIEPPIHPNNGEKIQFDFGMWPEEFKWKEFSDYVQSRSFDESVTNGVFAPWMMYKQDLMNIGGHDPILHSCREDSDIFNRMQLKGYEFFQPWNSLVYHFTGRGAGSFSGDEKRHQKWKSDMDKSTLEFIRKWKSGVKHGPLMDPIVSPVYDVCFRVYNSQERLIQVLEPWCFSLHCDLDQKTLDQYIEREQKNTAFDLKSKFKDPNEESDSDIVVSFDCRKLNNESFQILQNLSEIIKNTEETGTFEIDSFIIEIKNLRRYEEQLINTDSDWYLNKLLIRK
jgi:glycosyltransferase involved in cell wall biosynthesis